MKKGRYRKQYKPYNAKVLTGPRRLYIRELCQIHSDLAARQEPLGAEFEKVWNDNLETLYEN